MSSHPDKTFDYPVKGYRYIFLTRNVSLDTYYFPPSKTHLYIKNTDTTTISICELRLRSTGPRQPFLHAKCPIGDQVGPRGTQLHSVVGIIITVWTKVTCYNI